jgi:hypothetical protein
MACNFRVCSYMLLLQLSWTFNLLVCSSIIILFMVLCIYVVGTKIAGTPSEGVHEMKIVTQERST